jgi:hypothetical protein
VTRIGRWAGIAAAGAGLLIAAAVAAGLFDGGSSDAAASPHVRISGRGWFPPFAAGRRDYVTRCGSGSARVSISAGRGTRVSVGGRRARSGRFVTEFPRMPGQDFRVSAVAGDQQRTYEVRCLPPGFPSWKYERLRPGPAGLFTVAFRAPGEAGAWIIVFDQAGMPRWWLRSRGRVLWAQVLRDGRVAWARAFGDGYGLDPRSAHEVHALTGDLLYLVRTRGSITDGHELFELPNGDLLLDTYVPHANADLSAYGGPRRTTVVLPQIQQVDRQGRVVWRWDARGRISLHETGRWWWFLLHNPHPAPDGGPAYDAVHLNSIEPWGRSRLVMAARHTDAVYGVDRRSGRILFKLGGVRTPASLRVVGEVVPPRTVLGGPHDARIDAHGRLSVYDDGTHWSRPPRLVRYDLDLHRRTATFAGQLTDPEVRGSHCCGSARQFGDGWLVDWGNTRLITGFSRNGRIAFRLRLPAQTFRAVPVPPGAATAADLGRALDSLEPRPEPGR